ncbi:MAG: hypothetical protein IPO88_10360 [Nannocystis sp.]|uniref:(Na+)-NQR maturation NqrM n=1 Tax=Nannocystis sp. TaxID=1962667 RepID=UPI0024271093|nr:(Na+)-NQR maturation NqrM [Nannocystis sp.]MBK9753889.1 hypothetical protein [Nannocystis sp.]
MTTILLTIGVLGAVMFGMAIGAIFAGKTLRGSCGGIGNKSCDCGPAKKAECSDAKAA